MLVHGHAFKFEVSEDCKHQTLSRREFIYSPVVDADLHIKPYLSLSFSFQSIMSYQIRLRTANKPAFILLNE